MPKPIAAFWVWGNLGSFPLALLLDKFEGQDKESVFSHFVRSFDSLKTVLEDA